jgi:hypothetical protein
MAKTETMAIYVKLLDDILLAMEEAEADIWVEDLEIEGDWTDTQKQRHAMYLYKNGFIEGVVHFEQAWDTPAQVEIKGFTEKGMKQLGIIRTPKYQKMLGQAAKYFDVAIKALTLAQAIGKGIEILYP